MSTAPHPTRMLTSEEERLARMMKALGNPHRLAIVLYLAENPQCITGDIVDVMGLAQSTVSQHLKVLRDAGILCGTVEGPATSYCLDEDNLRWMRSQVNAFF